MTIKTAQNETGLRGVGLDYLIMDEAAFVPGEIWRAALRPALSNRNGHALFISTPRGRNWFWHAYQKGLDPLEPSWQSWRYPTITNPIISADDLAEARRDTPEHLYLQEYEAHFLEDGGQVFRRLQRAAIAPLNAEPIPGHRYMFGVDFGRYDDFTAVAVVDADEKMMVELDRFNLLEWSLQRERIIALANKWKPYWIVAEANAMGEPNIEMLRKAGLSVRRFQTTSTTKPQLIESLVAAIENVDLGILPDPVLLEELAAYTYRTSRAGHTIYEAPAGRHDDTVMALALAWSEASRPRIALGSVVI